MSRSRKFLLSLVSIIFGLVAGGVLTEAALRIGGYSPMYVNPLNAFHEGHPLTGYWGRPNFTGRFRRSEFDVIVAHDENGFRKQEYQQPEQKAGHKVMVFGDSFVWGWGVGQGRVFTDRMSQLMTDYRVMNFGLSASGTVQQFAIFEASGKEQMRPGDTVVLMFYANDFTDNVSPGFLHAELRNGEIRRAGPERVLASGETNHSLRKSYAVNLISFSVNVLKATLKQRRALERAAVLTALGAESPETAVVKHFLGEFQRAAAEKGASFIAVYVPLHGELGEASRPSEKTLKNEQDYRRAFFASAEAVGIRTIDLLPRFLEAKRSGRYGSLYLARDEHWNESGHEVAAKVLAEVILAAEPKRSSARQTPPQQPSAAAK